MHETFFWVIIFNCFWPKEKGCCACGISANGEGVEKWLLGFLSLSNPHQTGRFVLLRMKHTFHKGTILSLSTQGSRNVSKGDFPPPQLCTLTFSPYIKLIKFPEEWMYYMFSNVFSPFIPPVACCTGLPVLFSAAAKFDANIYKHVVQKKTLWNEHWPDIMSILYSLQRKWTFFQ